MKTSTVVVLFALQFMLFATIGTSAFLYGQNLIDEANTRSVVNESRGRELEKQTAELSALLAKEIAANKERIAEFELIKARNGELDKQIAELNDASKKSAGKVAHPNVKPATKWVLEGVGPADAKNDLLQEQLLKQLGNIQIRGNGLGIGGSITINGQTLQFGGDEKIQRDENVKKILDELEEAPEKKPAEKAKTGEKF